MNSILADYDPYKGEIPERSRGSLLPLKPANQLHMD